MKRVYVLNSGYQYISRCKVIRALELVRHGRAQIVKDSDRILRSVHGSFVVPKVIKVHKFVPLYNRKIKFSNRMVWERDGFTCRYCGMKITSKSDLTTDHVKPRSRGGKTNFENMVTACAACNSKKGNKTLEEAGMRILGDLPLGPPEISPAMAQISEEVQKMIKDELDEQSGVMK